MKVKFKAGLMAKGLNEGQAEYYANLVTISDESEIEGKITELMGIIPKTTPDNSEIDRRVNEAVQTATANYEKKHNLKNGIKIETPNTPSPPNIEGMNAEVKAMLEQVQESNRLLTEKFNGMVGANQTSANESIRTKLLEENNIPKYLHGSLNVDENTDMSVFEANIKTVAEGQNAYLAENIKNSKQGHYGGGQQSNQNDDNKMNPNAQALLDAHNATVKKPSKT